MFFIPTGTTEKVARRRYPYVTTLLLIINIAVFAYELYVLGTFGETGLNSLFNQYAVTPSDITDGTPLEAGLLTSMFLHGSILHLVGNMLFLLPFGDNVEDRLGHFRFLVFYLLSGVIATLGYIFFNSSSDIPLLGASGAIAGVLAGYLTLHFSGVVRGYFVFIFIPFRVQLPALFFIGYWFVIQLLSSKAALAEGANVGGVAFMAHVIGFVAGLILAPLLAIGRPRNLPHHER